MEILIDQNIQPFFITDAYYMLRFQMRAWQKKVRIYSKQLVNSRSVLRLKRSVSIGDPLCPEALIRGRLVGGWGALAP